MEAATIDALTGAGTRSTVPWRALDRGLYRSKAEGRNGVSGAS